MVALVTARAAWRASASKAAIVAEVDASAQAAYFAYAFAPEAAILNAMAQAACCAYVSASEAAIARDASVHAACSACASEAAVAAEMEAMVLAVWCAYVYLSKVAAGAAEGGQVVPSASALGDVTPAPESSSHEGVYFGVPGSRGCHGAETAGLAVLRSWWVEVSASRREAMAKVPMVGDSA